jgi:LysR family transcriptional regulator, transcriptional activator of the cysJI operon
MQIKHNLVSPCQRPQRVDINDISMKKTELNFDLKQLRSFLTIVAEKSFTRASRKLKIGQSTISHQIAQLEEVLGIRLFNRSGKDLHLTDDGKRFMDFSENLLEGVEKLKAELGSRTPGTAVRVSASSIPSTYILPGLIAQIYRKHPDYYYNVETANSREAIELVKEGSAEAGIVGKKIAFPGLKFSHCFSDEIVLIGPAGGEKRIGIDDLKSLPMINRERGSGTRDAYEKALNDNGILPSDLKIVYQCSSSEGVKQSVFAGMGYSFISSLALRDEKNSQRFTALQVEGLKIKREFFVVYSDKRKLSEQGDIFVESLKKQKKK